MPPPPLACGPWLPGPPRPTAELEAAAKRWLARVGKVVVKVEDAHFSREDDRSNAAWFDAALVAGRTRWRITGVMAHPLIQDDDTATQGPFEVVAAHLSEAVDDKPAIEAAAAGKLPALPTLQTDRHAREALDPSKIIDVPSAVAADHGERAKLVAAHFSVATR